MSAQKMRGGVIHIEGVPVARVKEITIDVEYPPIDATELDSTAITRVSGLPDGTVDLLANWDSSDAGQEDINDALAAGTELTVSYYPTGATTAGEPVFEGEVLWNKKSIKIATEDGYIPLSVSGLGALIEGTVT